MNSFQKLPRANRTGRLAIGLLIRKSNQGQAMIEFLFTVLLFIAIVFFALQITIFANVRSMLNLAGYAACREYVTSYSSGKAQFAAGVFMRPFLPGVGNGEVMWVSVSAPNDPGFGREATVTTTAYYKLAMPLIGKYIANLEGYLPIKTSCTMTME